MSNNRIPGEPTELAQPGGDAALIRMIKNWSAGGRLKPVDPNDDPSSSRGSRTR